MALLVRAIVVVRIYCWFGLEPVGGFEVPPELPVPPEPLSPPLPKADPEPEPNPVPLLPVLDPKPVPLPEPIPVPVLVPLVPFTFCVVPPKRLAAACIWSSIGL